MVDESRTQGAVMPIAGKNLSHKKQASVIPPVISNCGSSAPAKSESFSPIALNGMT